MRVDLERAKRAARLPSKLPAKTQSRQQLTWEYAPRWALLWLLHMRSQVFIKRFGCQKLLWA
jgi:hypothetical protein